MTAETLKNALIAVLEDRKGEHVVCLDVRALTDMTDCMIVVSGTSSRHVRSLADAVVERAREVGKRPLGHEGEDAAEWVLVDFGDVLVHVMQPRVRELYDLESLWSVGPARDDADTPGTASGS